MRDVALFFYLHKRALTANIGAKIITRRLETALLETGRASPTLLGALQNSFSLGIAFNQISRTRFNARAATNA